MASQSQEASSAGDHNGHVLQQQEDEPVTQKNKHSSSKYDFVKVRVWLNDTSDNTSPHTPQGHKHPATKQSEIETMVTTVPQTAAKQTVAVVAALAELWQEQQPEWPQERPQETFMEETQQQPLPPPQPQQPQQSQHPQLQPLPPLSPPSPPQPQPQRQPQPQPQRYMTQSGLPRRHSDPARHRGDGVDGRGEMHYYVLSRFLVSRVLAVTQVRRGVWS